MEASDPWRPLAETLLGKTELSAVDVARESGFALEALRRLWRALGFPPVADDAPLFTRSDVEVLRAVRLLLDLQGTDFEVLLQLTRVTGQSLARIADAQVTVAAERLEQRTQEISADTARTELVDGVHRLA